MLILNPAQRITAQQALEHEYFKVSPIACEPAKLPKIEIDTHEYQVANRIKIEQAKIAAQKGGFVQKKPVPAGNVVTQILPQKRLLPEKVERDLKIINEPPAQDKKHIYQDSFK